MSAKSDNKKIPVANGQLKVAVGGYSCKGIKQNNEDAYGFHLAKATQALTKGNLAIIADGVSHASQAAEASEYCVSHFKSQYYQTPDTWSSQRRVSHLLNEINNFLFNRSNELKGNHYRALSSQWLTTVSGVILKSASAHIFHVGDSQVAKISNNQFEVLTSSHNRRLANQTSVLTRAIGADSHLKVEYHRHQLNSGDYFILTTDGVHEHISEEEIIQLTQSNDNLELVCQSIVERAKTNGSIDNITCVLVKIISTPSFQANKIRQHVFKKAVPPALQVAQKLDNYEVLKIIHNSPRSHLYLVRNFKTDKKYILKAPSKNFEEDEYYLQGFIREAWVGAKIDHPCMMKIFPVNSESQFLYHVCEFIDGQNLRQWMYDNPQPSIDQARQIIVQIAEALRMLKRMEIIHRDLKPDNLMIDNQGQIKLIDFGTVSIASLDENINVLTDDSPQGTLNYIAPETIIDLTADYQSDLFSLGVIAYEILTGELPYPPKKHFKNTPKRKRLWNYRSALNYRSDIPFWLDLALRKAVEADPKVRYEAYSQFIVDLSKPNLEAEGEYLSRPLLERNPLKFWQIFSGLLALLLIISLLY